MASALTDIPRELKPLTPFLQRAQELKVKDPTMSYWCSYYAVQQGVHLKPREKTSRNYLINLMAPLEAVKEDPRSNVLTNNDAACAYIEDFALRVFEAADNEDRRGQATRGTAKKFLAAANFLELLRVFEENTPPQPGSSTSSPTPASQIFSQHKEKIRYAKWKAADIAKAFREGRKPSPGPAHVGEGAEGFPADPASPFEAGFHFSSNPSSVILPGSATSTPKILSNPNSNQGSRIMSNTNSNVVSPVPGASRDASVSPRRQEAGLPMGHPKLGSSGLDVAGKGKGKVNVSPNPSGFSVPFPPNGTGPSPLTVTTNLAAAAKHGNSLPTPPMFPSFESPLKPNQTSPQPSGFATPGKPLPNAAPAPPSGPTPSGLFPPTSKVNGTSPGGWSTAATPGPIDDLVKRNNALQGTPTPAAKPEGPAGTAYPSNPYPPAHFRRPPVTPHMKAQAHLEDEGAATDEDDGWSTAPEGHLRASVSRNASWATAATAGAPSRQNSFAPPSTNNTQEPYYNQNLPRRKGVATPENEWAESEDRVGPLPESGKTSTKRVRWTPSVTGGMSSVASTSPPASPGSETSTLPALPDSSDSDVSIRASDQKEHTGAAGSPPTSVEGDSASTPKARSPSPQHTDPKKPLPGLPAPGGLSAPSVNGAKISPNRSPITGPVDRAAVPSHPPFNETIPFPGASAPGMPSMQTLFPSSANGSTSTGSTPPTTHTRHRASASFSGVPSGLNLPLAPPKPYPSPPVTAARVPTPPGTSNVRTPSPLQLQSSVLPSLASNHPSSSHHHFANSSVPSSSTTAPPPPPAPRQLPTSLSYRLVTAAKKHSKFAASALEFDDLETARLELTRALAILNGERTE